MSTAPGVKSKEQCKSSNWVFLRGSHFKRGLSPGDRSMLLGHFLALLSTHRTHSRPTHGFGCFGFDGHPAEGSEVNKM